MKRIYIFLIIFISIIALCWPMAGEQTKPHPDLRGAYLGQPQPHKKAVIFAPGIISISGMYEFALSFAPDGNEVIYTSANPKTDAYRIMQTRAEGGKWSKPQVLNLSQGARKEEMEAFFTPDGSHIYFAPYNEGMDVTIWAVKRKGKGWSKPWLLDSPLNKGPVFFPTCSDNRTLYYSNIKERKIYRAFYEKGKYSRQEPAGLQFGSHGFIAPDESFILVDSRQENGMGKMDIYVAFRKTDGSWSKPVSLGKEVNTPFSESCPSLSHDGKFIFFSRYNEPGELSNIYWISSEILKDLKSQTE